MVSPENGIKNSGQSSLPRLWMRLSFPVPDACTFPPFWLLMQIQWPPATSASHGMITMSCILTNHGWLLGLVNRGTGYSHTWGSPHCGFRMPGVPSAAMGFSIRWLWQGSWSHHQLCFWAEFRSPRGSLGAQIGRNVFAEIANISNHQCLEWRMGQEMRAKGKQRFQLGTSSENHAENLPKRFTAQGSWGLC